MVTQINQRIFSRLLPGRSSLALGVICLILLTLFTTCQQNIGFGETIDFDPPVLTVTSIVLPDGTEIPVAADDNKLTLGPGILAGPDCVLKGEAWDNILITGIQVEETGPNARVIDGKIPSWNQAEIGPRDSQGKQIWSITLSGIEKGERNLSISAFDQPKNIGPLMMKSLTLLVDTNPPIVESVKVERRPGISIDLLPKDKLETLDPNQFAHIDYFQNESFTIRASIVHDFKLSDVTLNFWDEQGAVVFTQELERNGGDLNTPMWLISAEMLIAANPAYATGRHYLKAIITAKAEAGHSGQNDTISNELYNLCWYPEADMTRIQMGITGETGITIVEKNGVLPVTVFDDDNINEVYTAIVPEEIWKDFESEKDDNAKLQLLHEDTNRESFTTNGAYPLRTNQLTSVMRNIVIPVTGGSERGKYRLVVLARDKKDTDTSGVWAHSIFTLEVMEEGIPIISVSSPAENTSPDLTNGTTFTIKGTVLNLDDVDFARIAWIPNGPGWDADTQLAKGQNVLINNTPADGITLWPLTLASGTEKIMSSGKVYKEQSFEQSFNIFNDFMYNNILENADKLFILYTQGKAGDNVFQPFRLMSYSSPPEITIEEPLDSASYDSNETIQFKIKVGDEKSVPIDSVKLISITESNKSITLTRGTGAESNIWRSENVSDTQYGVYRYRAIARDMLGNENQTERSITIEEKPVFQDISFTYEDDRQFATGETVTIQLVFNKAVSVRSQNEEDPPKLTLEGFIDEVPRYAIYTKGAGSSTLSFDYTVENNNKTNNGLKVTAIDNAGLAIGANFDTFVSKDLPLHIDGIAPIITGITLTGKGDSLYVPWLRSGAELEIKVKTDKEVTVRGDPKLKLLFSNKNGEAAYQTAEDGTTLVFLYEVQAGDDTEKVTINPSSCFTFDDNNRIIDTIGSTGNLLSLNGTPVVSGTIGIDTQKPAKLTVLDKTETKHVPPLKFQIQEKEITDKVEYRTGDTAGWESINSPYIIPDITDSGTYHVVARQIDRAGNESDPSDGETIVIDDNLDLVAVICDNPGGAYPAGSKLSFKLMFDEAIKSPDGSSGPSIRIGWEGSGLGGDIPLYRTFQTGENADKLTEFTYITFEWTVPADLVWEPLKVKAISLTGVTNGSGRIPGTGAIGGVKQSYNSNDTSKGGRPDIKILSQKPVINGVKTGAGGTTSVSLYTSDSDALADANTSALDNQHLVLEFSQEVWPEKGTITITPAGDWLIPPVLSTAEYAAITNALTDSSEKEKIYKDDGTGAYKMTTHGLIESNGYYVPDTATKYVLQFDKGLDDLGLRTIFNKAGYMKQVIDVHSGQITKNGSVIKVTLDSPLPDGRIWDIAINPGAFRDGAGNQQDAWNRVIWSGTTAAPVIRVNRTSNNHAEDSFNDGNAVQGKTALPPNYTSEPSSSNDGVSGTKVQYRIDCVTPNATIEYKILESAKAEIISTDTDTNKFTIPKSMDDVRNFFTKFPDANSQNPDVSVSDLDKLTGMNDYEGSGEIGDESLYTARKDYIIAQATITNLMPSDIGREGAFKTVVVYRNTTGVYTKFEGSDTYGGQPLIAGFPLSINDQVRGKLSKYAYKNGTDHIWITWEIVSIFYMGGVKMTNGTPYTKYENGVWAGDTDYFTPRSYGNYGLRVSNGF